MRYTIVSKRVEEILVKEGIIRDDIGSYQIDDDEFVIEKKEEEVASWLEDYLLENDYSIEDRHQINNYEIYTTDKIENVNKDVLGLYGYDA